MCVAPSPTGQSTWPGLFTCSPGLGPAQANILMKTAYLAFVTGCPPAADITPGLVDLPPVSGPILASSFADRPGICK
ncbi:unnamed protein product [Protopolystoma xenopodis]|uniref:Uncharacterized protein n=1 Tax=Protopolystoma xenopodis TaxID=117903 RepID=A0A448WZT3_9PLAT|nr:unnamed protein product [Protopolystoma xenopodis]